MKTSRGSQCPNCGNIDIRMASTRGMNLWRRFVGSRRRFCPRCTKRWIGASELKGTKWTRPFALALSVLFVVFVLRTTYRLVRRQVRLKEYAAAMERGDMKAAARIVGSGNDTLDLGGGDEFVDPDASKGFSLAKTFDAVRQAAGGGGGGGGEGGGGRSGSTARSGSVRRR